MHAVSAMMAGLRHCGATRRHTRGELMTDSQRGRRGAVATAVGEEIVRESRAVLAGLDAIRRKADAASGVAQGRLRLAAFPSVFSTLLPPILRGIPQDVRRAEVRRPSLEDAFLKLTGRSLDGEAP